MKLLQIICVMLLFSVLTQAQEFAPIGATWYHTNIESFTFFGYEGYVKTESVKDTIIQGHLCKKLTKTRYGSNGSENSIGDEYFYTSGDTVFNLSDNDTFYILYNWGAQVGDTWTTRTFDFFAQGGVETTIQVDNIGTTVISGETLRTLTVHTIDSLSINPLSGSYMGFGEPNARLTEKLGGSLYLFPQDYRLWDAEIKTGLRCYSDSTIRFNANISSTCDELLTSVQNIPDADLIHLSPNPFSSEIQLNIPASTTTEGLSFHLYNNLGQLVLEKTIKGTGSRTINVPNTIPQGVYYGVIYIDNQVQTTSLIKQ